ncbi:MAG: hypothetical protein ABFD80_02120, partial [Acidobacteriota bacterium]
GPQGQGFQMGARTGGGQSGARRQQPSRVWLQDKDGKLRMVFIRAGITDNSYTEVLRGDLKEGDEVIIGKAGAGETTTAATAGQRGPGGPMMFMR